MSGKRAFTLIELLVVISIIALLVAILLPALGKARGTAQTVQCSKQMGQIVTANHLYAHDYKGYFVPFGHSGIYSGRIDFGAGVTNITFYYRLISYFNMQSTKKADGTISGKVKDLIHTPGLWCPSALNRHSENSLTATGDLKTGEKWTNHYGMNTRMCTQSWLNKRDRVTRPSNIFLHGETNYEYEGWGSLVHYTPDHLGYNSSTNQFNQPGGNYYRASHNLAQGEGSANYGFCDGHVKTMRGDYGYHNLSKLTPAQKDANRTTFWQWWPTSRSDNKDSD